MSRLISGGDVVVDAKVVELNKKERLLTLDFHFRHGTESMDDKG